MIGAKITSEKDPADVRVPLSDTAGVGARVVVKLDGNTIVTTPALTQTDIDKGYVTVSTPGVSSDNAADLSANYDVTKVTINFNATNVAVGDQVRFTSPDGQFVITRTITAAERTAGRVELDAPVTVTNTNVAQATAVFLTSGGNTITGALTGSMSAAVGQQVASSEYRGVYLQGITVDSKGMVQATYGDGSKADVGAIALASFRNDSALKPIGNTKFVASDQSGTAIMTRAGAPFAGDILSGTLEQANVDITQELMTMLKAQQLYNGNARMLQAAMEVGSRVTDKI
jgi:flagellar hook-basal body protein